MTHVSEEGLNSAEVSKEVLLDSQESLRSSDTVSEDIPRLSIQVVFAGDGEHETKDKTEIVADIGCGTGYYASRMAKEVGPEGQVICRQRTIDPSPGV